MTPFDLVLLPFPFTDLRTRRQRPCVVLAAFQPRGIPKHYAVAMVTSNLSGLTFPGDTQLARWREAGLPKPSLVRLAKVVTVERSLIRKTLGTLEAADRKAIRQQFRHVFCEVV
jgi:PemK-like, MazF-like toxin of type II toxin-antitoxin system